MGRREVFSVFWERFLQASSPHCRFWTEHLITLAQSRSQNTIVPLICAAAQQRPRRKFLTNHPIMGNVPAGARQCDPKFLDTTPGPRLQDGLRAKSSEILGSLSWEILGKRQRICAVEPYQMRGDGGIFPRGCKDAGRYLHIVSRRPVHSAPLGQRRCG